MDSCPSCAEETIAWWDKASASDVFPRKCRSCGEPYYISSLGLVSFILSTEFLFWGSIALAVILESWLVLVLFPIGVVIGFFLIWRLAEIRTITRKEVRKARVVSFTTFGALVGLVAIYSYFFRQ